MGCKRRLDRWLQTTLEDLQYVRKGMVVHTTNPHDRAKGHKQMEDELAEDQQRIIANLSGFIVAYQDQFNDHWYRSCYPLVLWANRLLWSSTTVAITLTAYMLPRGSSLAQRRGAECRGARSFQRFQRVILMAVLGLPDVFDLQGLCVQFVCLCHSH